MIDNKGTLFGKETIEKFDFSLQSVRKRCSWNKLDISVVFLLFKIFSVETNNI